MSNFFTQYVRKEDFVQTLGKHAGEVVTFTYIAFRRDEGGVYAEIGMVSRRHFARKLIARDEKVIARLKYLVKHHGFPLDVTVNLSIQP
jgi:hypothetical protein